MKQYQLFYFLLIVVTAMACGGGLTDEQRKKIKEEMETSQIKRISEADITEATLENGRRIVKALDPAKNYDSIAKANKVKIVWLQPGTANASEIENQLIEAYITNINSGSADNIQKIGADSLLYTLPLTVKQADGSELFQGIWSIYFSRKQVVLALPVK